MKSLKMIWKRGAMLLFGLSVLPLLAEGLPLLDFARWCIKDAPPTGGVSYAHPSVLSNIGTISIENKAVCNLLTKHKAINKGAHILVSSDKPVSFSGQSSETPYKWQWTAPGATNPEQDTQKAEFEYKTPGIYDYPTLSVETSKGKSSYKPDLKLKVGGTSELTTIDMLTWGETYLLGTQCFDGGPDVGGYVGGTNNKDIVGFGNLFMFGTDEAYMDGVNIYFHHKPKKIKKGAQIRMQVWLSKVTEDDLIFTHLPIEGALLDMKDIKSDGEDGAWALSEGGAVASFAFDIPIDLHGKPIIFISVEGFSNDPATEDVCLLMDVQGKTLDQVTASNRLAHNSFARLKGENDYLRPISSYGGGFGSFAICPIVRIGSKEDTGLERSIPSGAFDAHFANNLLKVVSSASGSLGIYNLNGLLVAQYDITSGISELDLSTLPSGVYLVKNPLGKTIKIIKQYQR